MSISNVEFQQPKLIDMFYDDADGEYLSSINASESNLDENGNPTFTIKPVKDPVAFAISILKESNAVRYNNKWDSEGTWFRAAENFTNDDGGVGTLYLLGKGWTPDEITQIANAFPANKDISLQEALENDYSEDDDIDEELFTKDAETDREFNVADYKKENMFKRFGTIKGLVQQYYNMIDGAFNTIDDVTNLLKAIYEIVARRYFEAKRLRDFTALRDWEKLISEIPDINIAGATFEGASDEYGISEEVYVLAQKWWNKINSTRNAVAMVMAITLLIEKLVQDQDNPEAADLLDVKEELDEELLDKVHSDGRAQVDGVYSAR